MTDTVFLVVPQKDRRIGVEIVKPNGVRRLIPDFRDLAEANAWIIQTRRLIEAANPHLPGGKRKVG